MKIPVDELLYSICECTFYCDDNGGCELYSFPTDDEYSPMYWASGRSEYKTFIDYDKFMRRTGEKNNG